jgi:hypothetical protein
MFTYKRVGGLHFVRIMRLGFSFYIASKPKPKTLQVDSLTV